MILPIEIIVNIAKKANLLDIPNIILAFNIKDIDFTDLLLERSIGDFRFAYICLVQPVKSDTIIYKLGHYIHRYRGPAIIHSDNNREWFRKGKRHRIDGPAIVRSDGSKEWYLNGKLHRGVVGDEDPNVVGNGYSRNPGPAIVRSNGSKEWYLNGKLHRGVVGDEDPNVVGNSHSRNPGPAIVRSDGSKFWYLNGLLHRENGPAIEYSDGNVEWYLNGRRQMK